MVDATSVDRLVEDLARLGVSQGDVVMVHASLRRVGPTEGRAEGLVRALDAAVGHEGTIVMMIGADDGVFDARSSPAQPDIGALAEVFRTMPGTVVNDHPEGRFAARGRRAPELIEGQPWDDYYGPGSPLERIVETGGKVLRLGSDLDTVTMIHYAEYLADVAEKRRVERRREVVGPDGRTELRWVRCLDDEHGIVDHPGEDYFATICRGYLGTGRASVGVVGRATAELLDAADLVAFAVEWMERTFEA